MLVLGNQAFVSVSARAGLSTSHSKMAALWRCACGRSLVSRALPSTKYFLSPGNSVQNVKRFSVFAEGEIIEKKIL